jgi:hypothetical protein
VTAPFGWWWAALAASLTAAAVATSREYALAVPLATAAVIVAAVAVGDAAGRTAEPRPPFSRVRPVPPSSVRDWLAAGELGREDLVLLLDRLERKSWNPHLPARTPQEIGRVVNLPLDEFHRYLAGRLTRLEGAV